MSTQSLGMSGMPRRSSSRSMATRMKSDRFSPGANDASTRANVPAGSRAGVCSSLIFGLPTPEALRGVLGPVNIFDITYLDAVSDITYVVDINNGGKHMATTTQLEILSTAHDALVRVGSFEVSPVAYVRADNRLFDACLDAGMAQDEADHVAWAAQRVVRWLVAA